MFICRKLGQDDPTIIKVWIGWGGGGGVVNVLAEPTFVSHVIGLPAYLCKEMYEKMDHPGHLA